MKEKLMERIIYKITDLNTGKFYIGETHYKDRFLNGKYDGSGGNWKEYYKKYKHQHIFKREILREDFKDDHSMHYAELEEIKKYCIQLDNGNWKVDESTGCMNKKTTMQSESTICPECKGINFNHYKTCSKFDIGNKCTYCGKYRGHHNKDCPMYKEFVCLECGCKHGHHSDKCSKSRGKCQECGYSLRSNTHAKTCSKYKEKRSCLECGSKTIHKSWCNKYKPLKPCSECGGIRSHYKSCSKYKEVGICNECGSSYGKHKKDCSKYIEGNKCQECGVLLRTGKHKKFCSKYKSPESCEECDSTYGHMKYCSKYKKRLN